MSRTMKHEILNRSLVMIDQKNTKPQSPLGGFATGFVFGLVVIVIAAVFLLAFVPEAKADERSDCLARIAYAESRGTGIRQHIAVMSASVNHAKQSGKPLCKIPAKQKIVPTELKAAYTLLAGGVLSGRIPDVTHGANSWRGNGKTNTFKKVKL